MKLENLEIFIGTNNKNKFAEFEDALKQYGIKAKMPPMKLEIEETGVTYRENALIKARAYARETGGYVLSDDTGLEIDILHGQPGLLSARYSGKGPKGNLEKVMTELRDIPDQKRTAKFICWLALVGPKNLEIAAEGIANGRIIKSPRGKDGFGYDPIFEVISPNQPDDGPEEGKTFAQMSMEEKRLLSHRGIALINLVELIKLS